MLRFGILTITLLLVLGCESTPTTNTTNQSSENRTEIRTPGSILELIAAAESAEPARANFLRLQAAELALNNQNSQQAKNIINSITQPVNTGIEYRFAIVNAKLAIQDKNGPVALKWLRDLTNSRKPTSEQEQLELGRLRADAYYVGRSYLASARERIFFSPLLQNSEKQDNQEIIFATLLELPTSNLEAQAKKAITSELRGWLSLAAMTKRFQDRPVKQLDALKNWQAVWANHPAAKRLPSSLASLSNIVQNQATSIALFLPITGDLGAFGRAIRDGIIASRYQLERDVNISVYDTNSDTIDALVAEAKRNGAELGIGPLERDKVLRLAAMPQLPMPILALNRAQGNAANGNLYQFGLAPEDEMIQVAEQVFREGKRNALIIYPESEWGERNVSAFKSRWQTLGGNTVNQSSFDEQRDYSDMVKSLLSVDESEARAANLRRITGQSFEFTPRRRQDIDFVFLLANQGQARGINPTLAFYYAEDIPVYSTSHVYELTDSKIESIDLNGIRFCDIPWKLGNEGLSFKNQLQQLWPNSNSSLSAFYALGIDAFTLYPRLEQMKRNSNEKIFGQTGILRLDQENTVVRTLSWAQFTNGAVVAAPRVVDFAAD